MNEEEEKRKKKNDLYYYYYNTTTTPDYHRSSPSSQKFDFLFNLLLNHCVHTYTELNKRKTETDCMG